MRFNEQKKLKIKKAEFLVVGERMKAVTVKHVSVFGIRRESV